MSNITKLYKCFECGVLTPSFNYGVSSCGKCKGRYRRVRLRTFKECTKRPKNQPDCKCGFCRQQRWHRAAFRISPSRLNISSENVVKTKRVIRSLNLLISAQEKIFVNKKVTEDRSLEDFIHADHIIFSNKPKGFKNDFYNWTFMIKITAIDLLKKLDIIGNLSTNDSLIFAKSAFYPVALLMNGMRCFKLKKLRVSFPGDIDVFPQETVEKLGKDSQLLVSARSNLIQKYKDLSIEREEYLLLIAIIACNPALSDLSNAGRQLLTTKMNYYNSILFNYCQLNYRRAIPRYTELLTVFNVVVKIFSTVKNVMVLTHSSIPENKFNLLCRDFFNSLYK